MCKNILKTLTLNSFKSLYIKKKINLKKNMKLWGKKNQKSDNLLN
jgi:hypothetical protein